MQKLKVVLLYDPKSLKVSIGSSLNGTLGVRVVVKSINKHTSSIQHDHYMEASHMGNNIQASHINIAKCKYDNEYKLDGEKKMQYYRN